MRSMQWALLTGSLLAGFGCSDHAEKTAKSREAPLGAKRKPVPPESEARWKIPDEFPGLKGVTDPHLRIRGETARVNLVTIGRAIRQFVSLMESYPFPGGTRDLPAEYQGLLSWRVHLLWMMDESPLRRELVHEQAWDSDVNKPFIDQMPAVFELIKETKPGHSQFVAPGGPGFIVDGETARSPREIEDDPATTIVLVTVKPEHAQLWTKPGGLEIDPEKAADILGGDPNGFLALFADGSIRTLDPNMDPAMLKALLTVAGGEEIDASKLPTADFPQAQ